MAVSNSLTGRFMLSDLFNQNCTVVSYVNESMNSTLKKQTTIKQNKLVHNQGR